MERRRIRRQQRQVQREEEERLARHEEEESAFRNDNRDFGFRSDQRPNNNNTITMPLRRNPNIPIPPPQPRQPPNISFTHRNASFRDFADQYVAQNVEMRGEWNSVMEEAKESIVRELESKRGNKIFFSVTLKMNRRNGEFTTFADKNIRIKEPRIIYEGTNINALYDEMMNEIDKQVDLLQDTEGSGWEFVELDKIDILTVVYDPLSARKWIPLPKHLSDKKAVINIQNKDENCFMWCIALAISPTETNPQRVDKNLKEVAKTLNMKGIRAPTPIDDIEKFENQNPDIAVVVLGLNEFNNVIPLRPSKFTIERKHFVLLLLIKDHYTLVNSSSKLISSQHSKNKGKTFTCWNCLNFFRDKDKFLYHRDQCQNHNPQTLTMPKAGTFVEFKNYQHTKKYPFAIYADIESLTKKIEYCDVNPEISYTTKIQKHEPISYVFRFVSFDQSVIENKTIIYTGEDAMENLVIELEYLASLIYKIPQAKPIYGREEKIKQTNTNYCHLCGEGGFLTRKKLRDFNFYTGEYLGPCHYDCRSKQPEFIPIFFHNLSHYDSHLFITNLASKINGERIDVIPNNEQNYISYTKHSQVDVKENDEGEKKNIYFKLRFVDSLKFMGSSLASLASNLPNNKFFNLENRFSGSQLKLAKRKGVFPYDWFNSLEKLNYKSLPPKEEFYSLLKGEGISEEEYAFALEVWEVFGCETFKDYLELYNEIDVLLLADVFENFRDICMENYGIDPAYYYTSPGLFWDAMLKETKVRLELLSDIDQFYFFKRMIRGGISNVSNRYAEANNIYMGDLYNPEKEKSYICYFDANNLYGFIMMQKLPYKGFTWMTNEEMDYLFKNQKKEIWETMPCALEVDLEYPKDLHDLHNDLPLCPENKETKNKINKLIPNLNNKEKYVIHYRTLLLCLRLGLKLKKIHKGIKFEESDWMKPYIDKNTRLRTLADNEFDKDFFKLGNNSVFGKTFEDETKRCSVELVTSGRRLKKLASKGNFKGIRLFKDNLVSVHMAVTEVKVKKPIYVGATVLDTSKIPMYEFHYEYIKEKYGENAKLLDMDTDGVKYYIKTEDIYKDMNENISIFDTSNYPKNHPSGIKSGINKKVPGKFKDELGGEPIIGYVGLRPKLYSYLTLSNKEEKKAKGVKKNIIKNGMKFKDYKDCLFNKTILKREQYNIRSYDHEVYTEKINKIALSPFDDKRYILEDGIHTLAWGSYKIKE